METTEIVKRLRALALEIERGSAPAAAPTKPAEPAAAVQPQAAPDMVVTVGYWKVSETKTGKPMGKLGYTDGEGERVYLPCFDEKVLLAVDPLAKGETVALRTKPWQDTKAIVSIARVPKSACAPTGICEDEIPF